MEQCLGYCSVALVAGVNVASFSSSSQQAVGSGEGETETENVRRKPEKKEVMTKRAKRKLAERTSESVRPGYEY